VFDRIRENVPRMPRAAFSQIVNRSMSEVLTRSLATSFTTLLAVLSLLIFGSATLQDFAFAMLIGIASGTYSSIFIASPVLTAWKEREPQYIRRRLRIAEVEGGTVPAFADDVQVALLADEDEAEGATVAPAPRKAVAGKSQPTAAAIAAQERLEEDEEHPELGDEAPEGGPVPTGRAARATNGAASEADPESAERRKRNDERRARREARRKGGRKRR
jgi:SecD/SecF fusion protein